MRRLLFVAAFGLAFLLTYCAGVFAASVLVYRALLPVVEVAVLW